MWKLPVYLLAAICYFRPTIGHSLLDLTWQTDLDCVQFWDEPTGKNATCVEKSCFCLHNIITQTNRRIKELELRLFDLGFELGEIDQSRERAEQHCNVVSIAEGGLHKLNERFGAYRAKIVLDLAQTEGGEATVKTRVEESQITRRRRCRSWSPRRIGNPGRIEIQDGRLWDPEP